MHPVCCSKDVVEAIFSASLSLWPLFLQKWFHAGFAATFHHPSPIFQLPYSLGYCIGMESTATDCCSVNSDGTSKFISLFLGFCSACKAGKASEKMTALGCVTSFFSRSDLAIACSAFASAL